MKEKSLNSIEYNVITHQLAQFCVFSENKEAAVKIVPFTDNEEVYNSLLATDTVMSYMLKYGNPSLDSANGKIMMLEPQERWWAENPHFPDDPASEKRCFIPNAKIYKARFFQNNTFSYGE